MDGRRRRTASLLRPGVLLACFALAAAPAVAGGKPPAGEPDALLCEEKSIPLSASLEEVREALARARAERAENPAPQGIVLNGRGYNYRADPASLDAALLELERRLQR